MSRKVAETMSAPSRRSEVDKPILAITVLGSLEFLGAGLAAVFGFQEAETPILFGLSPGRVGLAMLAFVASAAILGAGIQFLRRQRTLRDLSEGVPASLKQWLVAAAIIGAAVAWISIFSPPYVFGERAAHFARLRPLLVAAGLFIFELWSAYWLSFRTGTFASWLRGLHIADRRTFGTTFLCLLAVWLLMLMSKFGINKTSPFWNPPGIPLTGLQGIGVVGVLCLGVLFASKAPHHTTLTNRRVWPWLLPVAIYVCAAVVWGLTPMRSHYFSLRPAAPSFEPYPFSDARTDDLGAISIISGQGIYFHDLTDRPLYMVFLAFLHWLGGNNYVMLTWLQTTALASIPVMLFFLGRQFHSEVLGGGLALMTILQQANSIRASLDIDSVNPKLLMTEVPTMLGMVVIAHLLFRWFRTQRPLFAVAAGAAIAAASLIRVNPIFLFPVVGMVTALVFRRQRRLMVRHILLFSAGFVVVFTPWLVTGVNPAGVPWAWVKFQYAIERSLSTMVAPAGAPDIAEQGISGTPRSSASVTAGNLASASPSNGTSPSAPNPASENLNQVMPSSTGQGVAILTLVPRSLSHGLHNVVAVLLSLPDIVTLDTLDGLSHKDPWGSQTWTGDLTPAQNIAAVGNLALLAIGLAWSWQRFRLAGLVPALVFIGYDLSLSAAATSGGRYIVPINWVAHFYYALGLIAIFGAVAHVRMVSAAESYSTEPAVRSVGRYIVPTVAATVFVALLIPFANVVLPRLMPTRVEERARSALAAALPEIEPGVQFSYGEAVYPYYDAGAQSFSFDLIGNTGYQGDLVVARDDILPRGGLQTASLAVAGLFRDDEGLHVKFLYVADLK